MSDDLDKLVTDLGLAGREAARMANTAVAKTAADATAIAQLSAPVDTGNHRSTIGWQMIGAATAEFGPTSNYGAHLEYGTYKMAPRPHIHPAADAVTPGLIAALGQIGVTVTVTGGR